MRAAWYEKQGPAREVLTVGEMPDPHPGAGEMRIRIAASGVNPGDIKKREDAFGYGMAYPRVIPHSDGAGVVDDVGERVPRDWIGQRVWCYGAQSYRPFGTAAEFTVVPLTLVVPLADGLSYEQGACLGIPGITAHRAVHVAGPVEGRTVLVQGAAGAVGSCAVQFGRRAGARVIATCRTEAQREIALAAGADEVVLDGTGLAKQVRALAPDGVDHIVEVAFGTNVWRDIEMLAVGGSISVYATNEPTPAVPVWELVFVNARVFFLGSDDFPLEAKLEATRALNEALGSGWPGFPISARFELDEIDLAHEFVEDPTGPGRAIVTPSPVVLPGA